MIHQFIAGMFSVGIDILRTTVTTAKKNIVAQIGDVFTGTVERDDVEWWQHCGYVSRPPKPAAGSAACQAIIMHRPDRDVCLASRDTRGQTLSGNIGDGETCLYAPGADGNGQARVLLKADGSISIFTKAGNTDAGQGVIFQISAADESFALQSRHGMIKIDSSGITLTSGSAALQLKADGTAKLTGNVVQAQGQVASIAGSVATCIGQNVTPTPINAALHGTTGVAGVPSTNVYISI